MNNTLPSSTAIEPLTEWYWLFGCIAASGAAVLSIIGMFFMKMGFTIMQSLSFAEQQELKVFGIPKPFSSRPGNIWWGGFFLLVVAPLPLDFVALGLASASLVFPVGTATNVIFGQVVAPYFFDGEKLGRQEWLGTFLLVVGCCMTTISGDRTPRSFTANEILGLWGQAAFLVLLLPLTIIFIITVSLTLPQIIRRKLPKYVYFFCIVYIPSYLGGVQTISFKSVSEMTANAAGDEAGLGEWGTWKPWFFVCMVIPLAVFQLKVVNIGAEQFKATKYFPSYNTCLMILVVIFGAFFFEEHKSLDPIVFPIGIIILVFGIFLLAGKDPSDSGAVATMDRHEEELMNLKLAEEKNGLRNDGMESGADVGDSDGAGSAKKQELTKLMVSVKDNLPNSRTGVIGPPLPNGKPPGVELVDC